MIENYNQDNRKKKRDRIKQRIQVTVDEENYEYYPAQKQVDFYDTEVHQKVAAYCRVSTDSDEQQFSFELQKKYYEDYVASHGNWELTTNSTVWEETSILRNCSLGSSTSRSS